MITLLLADNSWILFSCVKTMTYAVYDKKLGRSLGNWYWHQVYRTLLWCSGYVIQPLCGSYMYDSCSSGLDIRRDCAVSDANRAAAYCQPTGRIAIGKWCMSCTTSSSTTGLVSTEHSLGCQKSCRHDHWAHLHQGCRTQFWSGTASAEGSA